MVSPQKRRLKYKNKVSSNGTKREYFKGKHKKLKCSLTGKDLHGVPHETKCNTRKHAKTEKRPSAPFGGILSGEARAKVFIEMGKVLAGIKNIDDVDDKYRKYVKQAMKRAEVN
jgi:ribosomal protein L34E